MALIFQIGVSINLKCVIQDDFLNFSCIIMLEMFAFFPHNNKCYIYMHRFLDGRNVKSAVHALKEVLLHLLLFLCITYAH